MVPCSTRPMVEPSANSREKRGEISAEERCVCCRVTQTLRATTPRRTCKESRVVGVCIGSVYGCDHGSRLPQLRSSRTYGRRREIQDAIWEHPMVLCCEFESNMPRICGQRRVRQDAIWSISLRLLVCGVLGAIALSSTLVTGPSASLMACTCVIPAPSSKQICEAI
jgi:hypothetical protein